MSIQTQTVQKSLNCTRIHTKISTQPTFATGPTTDNADI